MYQPGRYSNRLMGAALLARACDVLLARGLLKGGKSIDFAEPDNDEGGADATMARVINLVNDLVLRRDVSWHG